MLVKELLEQLNKLDPEDRVTTEFAAVIGTHSYSGYNEVKSICRQRAKPSPDGKDYLVNATFEPYNDWIIVIG